MRLRRPTAALSTTPRRLIAALILLFVAGGAGALTITQASALLSGTTANSSNTYAASSCFAPYAVAVTNNVFNGGTMTIKAGCQVKWTVAGGTSHNSRSTSPWVGLWSSANMNSGASFTYTFASTGTFPYRCSLHSGMTGTITVN